MIIVIHHQNRVVSIGRGDQTIAVTHRNNIAKQLFYLARDYPKTLIVWCESTVQNLLNKADIPTLFRHRRMLHSFGTINYLSDAIGFIEDSPFINVKTDVSYPTWRMHAMVGAVYSEILNAINGHIPPDRDFSYFLNSVAKLLMPQGLFCYSNPQLLKSSLTLKNDFKSSTKILFRFVKQHYKTQWSWFLLFCFVLYKKQFPVWSLLRSISYKRRQVPDNLLDNIPIGLTHTPIENFTVDVVIPTIGRKAYLYDVLKDLVTQTLLPKKVIIIEQNPDAYSTSELDYLHTDRWPFEIKHIFTHQTGACNARNVGLKEVTSEFVFLADDDNRFDEYLLEQIEACFKETGAACITTSYLQNNEMITHTIKQQWPTFGAGNSFLKMSLLNDIRFNLSLEHGYGEDADFGMQLRNAGIDIVYVPTPSILHLKAPRGGFRTKFKQPWFDESIGPKPSPTVMLFKLLHQTKQQLKGYQLRLLIHQLKQHKPINVFSFVSKFQKAWSNSLKWAYYLKSVK